MFALARDDRIRSPIGEGEVAEYFGTRAEAEQFIKHWYAQDQKSPVFFAKILNYDEEKWIVNYDPRQNPEDSPYIKVLENHSNEIPQIVMGSAERITVGQTVGAESANPIELLLQSPPGSASIARMLLEGPSSGQVVTFFTIHEDAQRARAFAEGGSVEMRAAISVLQDVALVAVLLKVAGEIYETWWNFHNPACRDSFYDLCVQEKLPVSVYVDRPVPERTVWMPNLIRSQMNEAVKYLEAMKPWDMAAFDRAREELYQEVPTVQALWAEGDR
jgi:hypothetical protein